MELNWSLQKEFEFQIREAIDKVQGVKVEPRWENGVLEIMVREVTTAHPLLAISIPADGVPVLSPFEKHSTGWVTDETAMYALLAASEYNFNAKRFTPVRDSVIDAVQRAINRVQRDFSQRAQDANRARQSGTHSTVNIGAGANVGSLAVGSDIDQTGIRVGNIERLETATSKYLETLARMTVKPRDKVDWEARRENYLAAHSNWVFFVQPLLDAETRSLFEEVNAHNFADHDFVSAQAQSNRIREIFYQINKTN